MTVILVALILMGVMIVTIFYHLLSQDMWDQRWRLQSLDTLVVGLTTFTIYSHVRLVWTRFVRPYIFLPLGMKMTPY